MTIICLFIDPSQLLTTLFEFIAAFLASPWRFLIGQINPSASKLTNITLGRARVFRDSISSSNEAVHLIGETLASFLTTKGHQLALPTCRLSPPFDVYWTGKRGCYLAFQQAFNKFHLVTCAPGLGSIYTGKSNLIHSLVSASGQDVAAFIVPRGHRLPSQYVHLVQYIQVAYSSGLLLQRDSTERRNIVGMIELEL